MPPKENILHDIFVKYLQSLNLAAITCSSTFSIIASIPFSLSLSSFSLTRQSTFDEYIPEISCY